MIYIFEVSLFPSTIGPRNPYSQSDGEVSGSVPELEILRYRRGISRLQHHVGLIALIDVVDL